MVEGFPTAKVKSETEPDPEKVRELIAAGHINPEIADHIARVDDEEKAKEKLRVVHLTEEFTQEFLDRLEPEHVHASSVVAEILHRAGALGVTMGSGSFMIDTMSKATKPKDRDLNFSIDHLDAVTEQVFSFQNAKNPIVKDFSGPEELDHGKTSLVAFEVVYRNEQGEEKYVPVELFAQSNDQMNKESELADDIPEVDFLPLHVKKYVVYGVKIPRFESQGEEITQYYYARSAGVELYVKNLITEFLRDGFEGFVKSGGDIKAKSAERLFKLQRYGVSYQELQPLVEKYLPPGLMSQEEKKLQVQDFLNKIKSSYDSFVVLKERNNHDAGVENRDLVTYLEENKEISSFSNREDSVEVSVEALARESEEDIKVMMEIYDSVIENGQFLHNQGFIINERQFDPSGLDSMDQGEVRELVASLERFQEFLDAAKRSHGNYELRYRVYASLIKNNDEFPAYIIIERVVDKFLVRTGKAYEAYGKVVQKLLELVNK